MRGPFDDLNAHEARDRLSVLRNVLSTELLSHAYVQANPAIHAKVEQAIANLWDAHQMVGQGHETVHSYPGDHVSLKVTVLAISAVLGFVWLLN